MPGPDGTTDFDLIASERIDSWRAAEAIVRCGMTAPRRRVDGEYVSVQGVFRATPSGPQRFAYGLTVERLDAPPETTAMQAWPFAWPATAVGVVVAAAVAAGCRWRLRRSWLGFATKAGTCPSCGYDLRATRHQCPECGWRPS